MVFELCGFGFEAGTPQRRAAATTPTEIGEALLVFRGEEDAEAFRRATGRYPASAGFKAASLDQEGISGVLAMHGLDVVAMPEPWTGVGDVDLFEGENFIRLLEEGAPA